MGRHRRAPLFLCVPVLLGACAPLAPGVDVVLPLPAPLGFRIEPSGAPWQQAPEDRNVVLRRWWPDEAGLALGRLAAGQDRGILSLVQRPGPGLHEAVVLDGGGHPLWMVPLLRPGAFPSGGLNFSLAGTVVALGARWAIRQGRDPRDWDVSVRTRSKAALELAGRLAKEVRGGSLPEGPMGWLERRSLSWEVRYALDDLASGSMPLATPSPEIR